jgi:hypothetical protein
MHFLSLANLLKIYALKIASGPETQYLTPQELENTLNTPDDPTTLSLYAQQRTKATNDAFNKFYTKIPPQKWSTYQDPFIQQYIRNRKYKYSFQYPPKNGGTFYVNLYNKILEQNNPDIRQSLYEICAHEAGHALYYIVKPHLSITIDGESFADIVLKHIAPREPFNIKSAEKQYSALMSILYDLQSLSYSSKPAIPEESS